MDFNPVVTDTTFAADNPDRTDTVRAVDFDDHLAGYDRENITEFGIKNTRQVTARFDEVMVTVTTVGQLAHQVLVEVGADTNGSNRDSFLD